MGDLRDAARTRQKIMEAARDEFAARGFAGARVEAIARRAGLSKQLLYHYFANKEALIGHTPGPRPLAHNGFKIDLLRGAVIRALETIGGQA